MRDDRPVIELDIQRPMAGRQDAMFSFLSDADSEPSPSVVGSFTEESASTEGLAP